MPYRPPDVVHVLVTVPAGDGNFRSALSRSSEDQVTAAIIVMTDSRGEPRRGHKARVAALDRRLRELRRARDD